jgi:hypothetical protein
MRTYTLLARNLAWYWRTNAGGAAGGGHGDGRARRRGPGGRIGARFLARPGAGAARQHRFHRHPQRLLPRGTRPAFQPAAPASSWTELWSTRRAANGRRACKCMAWTSASGSFKPVRRCATRARGCALRGTGARAGSQGGGRTPAAHCEAFGDSTRDAAWPQGRYRHRHPVDRRAGRRTHSHEFSLRPQQGDVRAVYVPLARLQRDLNQPGKVNTILVGRSSSAVPLDNV